MDFGFLVCRVMHFYGETYVSAMELPVRTFWLMSNCIDRIQAQQDKRQLSLAVVGGMNGTQEALESFSHNLNAEVGQVIKLNTNPMLDTERDAAGFAMLKAMAGQ